MTTPAITGTGATVWPLLDRRGVPYLLIVAAGLLVYGRTAGFGLTNYDDVALITHSQPFLLSAHNWLSVFTVDAFSFMGPSSGGLYYRPILWLSFKIDAAIGGADPAVYHVSNVVYHLIATALVYRLLERMEYGTRISLFLALFFLLHPALTQAVAWIPGRNDTLLAIFLISAVLALREFFASRAALPFAMALLSWNCLLYTKEGGLFALALFPILLVPSFRETRKVGAGTTALALLWLASAGIWLVMRRRVLGGFPLLDREIPQNIEMAFIYVGKTLIPFPLSVLPSSEDAPLLPGLVVALVMSSLLYVSRRRRLDRLLLGFVWFCGALAPALLASPGTRGLEHRLYAPMIGGLILLAEAAWPRLPAGIDRLRPLAAVGLLAVFATLTSLRLPDYADPRAYWESAAQSSPNGPELASGLCRVEHHLEQWEAAIPRCRVAIEQHPKEAALHYLLGTQFQRLHRWSEAEAAFRQSLKLDPKVHHTWAQLAQVLAAQGRTKEAAAARREGLARRKR